ncbi:MAG: MBL fold metallo-hydrolase [Candidatus Colwellbacteria bacterium]|nr:MBL fold metallo-hydrolase [Candidatus Colwellbacteria bacterium]
MTKEKTIPRILVLILAAFTVWTWFGIVAEVVSGRIGDTSIYFLDVGQGDSELIKLKPTGTRGEVNILIDGGRGGEILGELESVVDSNKYIDIVVLTHADIDHYGGIVEVINRYNVGLFVWNGQSIEDTSFMVLQSALKEQDVKTLKVQKGDSIKYLDYVIQVISPDTDILAKADKNESGVVLMFKGPRVSALFTGDVGFATEMVLLESGTPLKADVLKVGHHGSKNSSSPQFIAAVQPVIGAIGVGVNRYGHPAETVLDTLTRFGSQIYRTDINGTIKVVLEGNVPWTPKTVGGGLASIFTGSYKSYRGDIYTVSLSEAKAEWRASGIEALLNTKDGCALWRVDLNAASKNELMQIRHIGSARADALISARPFTSVEGIKGKVQGIGEARMRDIIDQDLACVSNK